MLATLSIAPPIATLSLNRPDARNALSLDLLAALHHRVDELAQARECHVAILTGVGKSFCAGMDLKAVLDNHALALQLLTSLARLTIKLRALPQVTVARVNGAAIGGGCGLACVCDLAVSHADAKLGFPEVDLGVCPAVVAPWLVKKVGPGRARAILLKGGLLSAAQALDAGILNALAPNADTLDAATHELTQRLATGGPDALRATKRLLNDIDGSLDESLVLRGAELSAQVLATPDAQRRLREKLNA